MSKLFRRLVAVTLAIVMCFCIGTTVFAADTTDINGVVGNPLVTSIDVIGLIPQFNEGEITVNKETTPFVNGYEIHPESGALYTVKVESGVGIKQIDTILNWGSSGSIW